MTDAVSHAVQSQKMVEAITQSAKAGGQVQKTHPKAAHDADDADNSDSRQSDHTAKGTRNTDDTARNPVEKTGKTAKKSHHDDDDKKDDKDKSFADTIDNLGKQSQPAVATDNAAAAASSAGWTADLVFRQPSAGHTKGDAPLVTAEGANNGKNARLGNLLKQDSIVALLDARQRLLSAHDAKDMPTDGDAGETTTTTGMTVQSRQSHWIFGGTVQSGARTFETLMTKDGKTSPTAAAAASVSASLSTAPKDAVAKSSADSAIPIQASHVAAPDDASSRQTFDGQQGSAGSGRDQMPSGNTSDKRNSNINAMPSTDHVSVDATDLPGAMSGATQQVKNGVLNALTGDKGSSTPQPNIAQMFQGRPIIPGQVLRSIDLTLSPPDLGTVRLRLSLNSNSLDIDAEASKASTAKLLDDDRKGLEQSLRDAGYDVKNLKIADASASSNSGMNNSQNGAGSSFQDGSQARANFSGRQDGSNMQRRDGANPGQSQQQRPQHNNNQKGSPSSEAAAGRPSNAIYI